ncbi:MAG: hypothetical protein Q7R33_05145 [Nitrosarchaeum sp.]|nr:hypothetical protein [Nitrosarchaeum sp.]
MKKINIDETVKQYQVQRKIAKDFDGGLQQSTMIFLQTLLKLGVFLNQLPEDVLYRQHRLKNLVAAVVQDIDALRNEMKHLDSDVSFQIFRLITAKQLEKIKEQKNERPRNARMVGKFNRKRKSSNH